MDEFQYFFGEKGFNLKEQRGLKDFFKYAKTHIRMNALLEKAFATAGKADSWNMIADAFGMKDYSTPITFFFVRRIPNPQGQMYNHKTIC